jgi:hypothetical protein
VSETASEAVAQLKGGVPTCMGRAPAVVGVDHNELSGNDGGSGACVRTIPELSTKLFMGWYWQRYENNLPSFSGYVWLVTKAALHIFLLHQAHLERAFWSKAGRRGGSILRGAKRSTSVTRGAPARWLESEVLTVDVGVGWAGLSPLRSGGWRLLLMASVVI